MIVLISTLGCGDKVDKNNETLPTSTEEEEMAILDVIYNETRAAFARDYESWKTYWVHEGNITKTYINFADSSFTETVGWKEIDDFVKTYIEEHPEPEPIPSRPDNVDIKLYGTGAWVSYGIMDEVFGLKRETRLMEKVDGQWKIAGLHTTIYGFGYKE